MSESNAPASAPSAAPVASSTPTSASPSVGTTATDAVAEVSPVAAEAAPETPAQPTKAELKAAIKEWKLKTNGKERTVTDESEMIRLAQLGLGANEKFEQAAKTRKEAEQVLQLLQTNPKEALKRLGHDFRKLSEDYLYEELQNEKLTPEQKEVKQMKAELDKYKAEKEQAAKQQEEAHMTRLTQEYEVSLQSDIIKAIDQYKLPNNPRTVARIAEYMSKALENGYTVDPLDVAPRVRADLEQEHKSMYSQYSVEDILKLIGDDKAKAIRQYEVSKVKAKAPAATIKTDSVASAPKADDEKKSQKQMTIAEMMSMIENELAGK